MGESKFMIGNWKYPGMTETIGDYISISYPTVKPMTTYVVQQTDKDGKKARTTLMVSVNLGIGGAILTESEQEELAKLAAKQLSYEFLGKQ